MSSDEKGDGPSLVDLAAMRQMGLLGGDRTSSAAKPPPSNPSAAGRIPSADLLESQERALQNKRAQEKQSGGGGHLFRDIIVGAAIGLAAAGMYAAFRPSATETREQAFRAAAREHTAAIGLGNAVYEVNAPQGACLHWVNEARAPINPVQCLPAGTLVRGIVAPPARTDVAEARQWLLVSLTDTEVRTQQKGAANEFPQGYLIPYGSVRPVTGAAASGATPK